MRQRERQTDRQTGRQTDRQKERESQRERERERGRDFVILFFAVLNSTRREDTESIPYDSSGEEKRYGRQKIRLTSFHSQTYRFSMFV